MITLKQIKKELEVLYVSCLENCQFDKIDHDSIINFKLGEVIINFGYSIQKVEKGVFRVFTYSGIQNDLINKYIGYSHFYPENKFRKIVLMNYYPTLEEKNSLDFYINSEDTLQVFIKNYRNLIENKILPYFLNYNTLKLIDQRINSKNGKEEFSTQTVSVELFSIPLCCITKNENRCKIIENRLNKIFENNMFYKTNYNIYLLLEGLLKDELIPIKEFNYFVEKYKLAR